MLKLIAAAAVEVRDVLIGLAGSSGGGNDTADTATGRAHGFAGGPTGEGYEKPDTTRRPSATLGAIVRNCNFLLKCRRLPMVSLARSVVGTSCVCCGKSGGPRFVTRREATELSVSH